METSKRCVLILTVPMDGAESVPIQELSRVLTARKLEPNPKPKFNEAGGGAQSFFFLFALAPIYTRPELKKNLPSGTLATQFTTLTIYLFQYKSTSVLSRMTFSDWLYVLLTISASWRFGSVYWLPGSASPYRYSRQLVLKLLPLYFHWNCNFLFCSLARMSTNKKDWLIED